MPIGVFIPTKPGHGERMRATLESVDLSRFVGGQAEDHLDGGILNGGKVFRGDIETIAVVAEQLVVRFVWLAVMSTPARWAMDPDIEMRFATDLIESCETDSHGRIVMQMPIIDQLLVLFPPGYAVDGEPRRLERSDISPLD